MRKAVILLLMAIFILPVFHSVIPSAKDQGHELEVIVQTRNQDVYTPSYIVHSPIVITTNADFISQGFPGTGTPGNPYVISGYNITTAGTCISIDNTDVYFVISDCLLTGGTSFDGVNIHNTKNGKIQNNHISQKRRGVSIDYNGYNMVTNNTISGNSEHGVRIFFSVNNTVTNNTISGNTVGVCIYGEWETFMSKNNYVVNNTISGNSEHGVYICSSVDNIVADNSISGNTECGVYLVQSSFNNEIFNNTISENNAGVHIYAASNNTVVDNTISGNSECGVFLDTSFNNTLSLNIMVNNGLFIFSPSYNPLVEFWWHNITADNIVNGKLLGYFWNWTGGTIDGTQYGQVILANCTGVTVENCVPSNVTLGIELGHSSKCRIINNTISRNAGGVGMYFSVNNTVANNAILGNSEFGVLIYLSVNNTVANNIISGNGKSGLFIANSSNNTISNNTISMNSDSGVYIDSFSSKNLIYFNILAYNYAGIIYLVNAYDFGYNNSWNITGFGNYWSDYGGEGVYNISGSAGSIDYFPLTFDPPMIDHPPDVEYEIGTTGHSITWSPTTPIPYAYGIFLSGSLAEVEPWDGAPVSIIVDGLNSGVYNYTIVVYDYSMNWVGDTVLVTVIDSDSPMIDQPIDIEYEEGIASNTITWSPSDADPSHYVIYRNGIEIVSDTWYGSSIAVNVDGLSVGAYNYTIVVWDISGNWVSDIVIVTVIPQTTTTTSTTTTGTTETSTTTTTTSTSTQTSTGTADTGAPMVLVIGATAGVVVVLILVIILKKKG